ncbi:hypothetical protein BDZ91DRAFT_761478 [Kalaharituber pfeilii]|nr:hypothetical protein BDZ91DRAFT_761478 [Kalaharituber pfeilii]
MSSPTYTQFNTATHPRHHHRRGSVSSNGSTSSIGSTGGGPILSSAWRRDSIAASPPATIRPRRASEADPFAAQRDSIQKITPHHYRRESEPATPVGNEQEPTVIKDRRMSREWDASKVPPSRFQRPEGKSFQKTNT